jgi:sulfatase maturation enzyme AslB (radical SAM superfamily)
MDIKPNLERSMVQLYPTALCNLNCTYCQIDKNSVLKEIDTMLEKSFNDKEYYFNRIKQYFPMPHQLTNLETWGGEPFLRIERIFPLLHQLIEYYPYLSNLFSSTNFSFVEWPQKFLSLMNELGNYPDRIFNYTLQLSCDGPEYINDLGRGNGVTEKCLNNFNILLQELPK